MISLNNQLIGEVIGSVLTTGHLYWTAADRLLQWYNAVTLPNPPQIFVPNPPQVQRTAVRTFKLSYKNMPYRPPFKICFLVTLFKSQLMQMVSEAELK